MTTLKTVKKSLGTNTAAYNFGVEVAARKAIAHDTTPTNTWGDVLNAAGDDEIDTTDDLLARLDALQERYGL